MTKETLLKMVGGLPKDERQAALNELNVTDAALVAECLAYEVQAAAVPVTAPAINPVQPAVAAAVPGGNAVTDSAMQQLQQQLNTEKAARITAECDAFFAGNTNKVTPAEMTEAKKTYAALAALDDQTALNSYKASMQARPANPLLNEQVAASGAVVLGSHGSVDTRTETEKDTALVASILQMTPDGQTAAQALKTGTVAFETPNGQVQKPIQLEATLKQFNVGSELITK